MIVGLSVGSTLFYQWLVDRTLIYPALSMTNAMSTGAIIGSLVGVYDVKRVQHIEHIEAREQEFQAIFDGTLDTLLIADDERQFLDANRAACEFIGVPKDELLTWSVDDLASDGAPVAELWAQFLEDGELPGEFPIQLANGEERIVEFRATANILPNRHLSVLRDITDRKQQEKELREERERMEFLNQVLRHEVLNATNIILGEAEQARVELTAADNDRLQAITSRAEHISSIIDRVKNVIQVFKDEENQHPVNLSQKLRMLVDETQTAYPDAIVSVDGEIPDQLQVSASALLITTFENLLGNAIQHNDKGQPCVSLSVEADDKTVLIQVADNGPGISDDRKQEIFGKGERGIKNPGSGFGLYFAETVIDNYGGELWVEDNEPDGAIFAVRLPLL